MVPSRSSPPAGHPSVRHSKAGDSMFLYGVNNLEEFTGNQIQLLQGVAIHAVEKA